MIYIVKWITKNKNGNYKISCSSAKEASELAIRRNSNIIKTWVTPMNLFLSEGE